MKTEAQIRKAKKCNKKCKKALQRTEKVIKFYNDYIKMVSEANYKSIHGKDSKY